LLSRAQVAAARSRELVEEAAGLLDQDVVSARRPVRCAWCNRIEVAGGWRKEETLPPYFKARRDPLSVSHGICDDCAVRLKATGRSH
jgi:hypothetical protein